MHSFSLAGKYFVLVDYPLRAKDPKDLGHGFIEAFSWYEKESTTIYIIDRESGKWWTFHAAPFFSYHHVNGFEKDGKVYVDLIAYPTADIIYKVNSYPFVKNPQNHLLQLEMDLLNNRITIKEKTKEHFEFPRLNECLIGKPYQYFYAVHIHPQGDGIIKYDHIGSQNIYWFQEGCYANEPIFIPHPHAQSEDEGVILSVINDLKNKTSFLLILDAKNLKELARVEAPHFIPFGFHGQFFKDSFRKAVGK
jgi:carotenoid cleavage dioxygenase-like enzyme